MKVKLLKLVRSKYSVFKSRRNRQWMTIPLYHFEVIEKGSSYRDFSIDIPHNCSPMEEKELYNKCLDYILHKVRNEWWYRLKKHKVESDKKVWWNGKAK